MKREYKPFKLPIENLININEFINVSGGTPTVL